jgi:hypothetical protein
MTALSVAFWSKRVAASMVENRPADGLIPIVVAGAVTIGVALLADYAGAPPNPCGSAHLRSE